MIKILLLLLLLLILLTRFFCYYHMETIINSKISFFAVAGLSLSTTLLIAILSFDSTQFKVDNYVPEYLMGCYPEYKDFLKSFQEDNPDIHLPENVEMWKNTISEIMLKEDSLNDDNQSSLLNAELQTQLVEMPEYFLNFDIVKNTLLLMFFAIVIRFFFPSCYYNKSLKKHLDTYHHKWMGENNLSDIMVAINVQEMGKNYHSQQYDLIEYFSSQFSEEKGGVYIILGNPGEGKTLSLRKLADYLIHNKLVNGTKERRKRLIPVFLEFYEIRNLSTNDQMLECIISEIDKRIQNFAIHIIIGRLEWIFKYLLRHQIKSGNLVLLIDGYDEIGMEQRYEASRMLQKFTEEYTELFLIVASRTAIYQDENYLKFKNQKCLYLSDFNRKQVEDFLKKWNFPEGKSRRQLYDQIMGNQKLERLSHNPLLLTLITYLYVNHQLLSPINTVGFYEESMNCLTDQWEYEKRVRKRFESNRTEKLNSLSYLAWELFINKKTYFTEADLLKTNIAYQEQYKIRFDKVLEEVYQESGILEKFSDGSLKFYHRSFHEYFTARYVCDENKEIDVFLHQIVQNSWMIVFFLSLNNDIETTEEFIKSHEDLGYLIGQILEECKIHDENIIERWMEQAIIKLKDGNETLFEMAGRILAKYPRLQDKMAYRLLKLTYVEEYEPYISKILSCVLHFTKKVVASKIIKDYLNKIDLSLVLQEADENTLDCFLQVFHYELTDQMRWDLVILLAENGYFQLLTKMFKESDSEDKRMFAAMGLLCMSSSSFFFDWLEDENLISDLKPEIKIIIKRYVKDYGWRNEKLNDIQLDNRFTLVYYACIFLNYYIVEPEDQKKIDNKMKYLITYVKNKEENTLVNYIIDIDNFEIKSTYEFEYHWKRSGDAKGTDYNPYHAANVIRVVFAFFLIFMMTAYIIQWYIPYQRMIHLNETIFYSLSYKISESQGWMLEELMNQIGANIYSGSQFNINDHLLGRDIHFNGVFLLFLGSWYGSILLVFRQLIKIEYTPNAIINNIIFGELLLL